MQRANEGLSGGRGAGGRGGTDRGRGGGVNVRRDGPRSTGGQLQGNHRHRHHSQHNNTQSRQQQPPASLGKRGWSQEEEDEGSELESGGGGRSDGGPHAYSATAPPSSNHQHQHMHKRVRTGEAAAPDGEREDDEVKVAARLKQIAFGKNTLGYDAYIAAVPKNQRRGYLEHPRTPDPYEKQSKRMFDGKVRAWRRLLHNWDPSGSGGADDFNEEEDEGGPETAAQSAAAASAHKDPAMHVATAGTKAQRMDTTRASAPSVSVVSSSADMDALLAANMDEMDDDELDAFLASTASASHSSSRGTSAPLSSVIDDAGAESFDEDEDVL